MSDSLNTPSFRCSAPATSANLGPGFDTLGLAFDLRNTVEVFHSDIPGVTIEVTGEGATQVAHDDTHLTLQGMVALFEHFDRPTPNVHLKVHNEVPFAKGLGSSATAIVLGLVVAKTLLEPKVLVSDRTLLDFAANLDGHPDNVAACLFGGLTLTWRGVHSELDYRRIQCQPNLQAVVGVPDRQLPTSQARGLLPENIAHADAAANSACTALLLWGIQHDLSVLFDATHDRIHQRFRESAYPETARAVNALRDRGFAAMISGAGPSFLVLCDGEPDMSHIAATVDPEWTLRTLALSSDGVIIE